MNRDRDREMSWRAGVQQQAIRQQGCGCPACAAKAIRWRRYGPTVVNSKRACDR